MRLAARYRWHRWGSAVTGVALVAWLVTGVWIVLPELVPAPAEAPPARGDRPRLAAATVPPARAAAALDAGEAERVVRGAVLQLPSGPAYAFQLAGGGVRHVDAVRGEAVALDAAAARRLVRRALERGRRRGDGQAGTPVPGDAAAGPPRVERITRHDAAYDHGPLPVWRVAPVTADGAWAHLSPLDGAVTTIRPGERRPMAIEHLHGLAWPASGRAAAAAVWVLSAAVLLFVLLGFTLLLPWRRARGRRRVVHKWLALAAGAPLLLWLVTGAAATWDRLAAAPPAAAPRLDLAAATTAPSELAARAGGPVAGATLLPVAGRPAWRLGVAGRGPRLFDAATGDALEIGPDEALRTAAARTGSPVASVGRIDRHGPAYAFGPLPVWAASVADGRGTRVYLSPVTGEARRDDRAERLRVLLRSVHTFRFLALLSPGRLPAVALVATGLLALAASLLGYALLWRLGRSPR